MSEYLVYIYWKWPAR